MIRDDIKALRKDVNQVNKSVLTMQRKQDDLIEENKKLTQRIETLERETLGLHNQTCRNNLIIRGIQEAQGETWEDCENAVRVMLKTELDIEQADNDTVIAIERAHRLNVKMKRGSPRPVIVKFLSYKTRSAVLQKARSVLKKDSPIFVTEDLPPVVRQARKKLIPFLVKARDEGKRAILSYDKLLIDGRKYKLDSGSNELTPI
ncbi:uncharacterized protein [Ptychodera flava]|uniref:uncharacterized protein n=1 Tax=Ptychodera flava TaxID=63121 RepID=UPI00396A86E8